MMIKKEVTHKVTFQVCEFAGTEGGMDYEGFGPCVNTLEEAIHLLELARAGKKDYDWIIACDVETIISKSNNTL